MPFSNNMANAILNFVMSKEKTMETGTDVFIGLCVNDPEAGKGAFSELSGKGYERVLIHQYNQDYPGLMDSASDRTIKNAKQIAFTKAKDGDWAEANGFGLFYEKAGGTPFYYGKLKEPTTTRDGAVFLFDPGELKIDFATEDVDIPE